MTQRITVRIGSGILGLFAAVGLSLAADAHTWSGTLIDAACKQANAKAKCDASSGTKSFALMMADGKMLRFDEPGNAKAMAAMETKKGPALGETRASVTGSTEGDTVKVDEVQIQ